ncbi:hypothetical protein RGZ1_221 [Morganella phage vB_MmoM_Rgz1]|nr:hypothetical protein RGZ1_221 [Morganella phage vB_MmoM_Rgz1]
MKYIEYKYGLAKGKYFLVMAEMESGYVLEDGNFAKRSEVSLREVIACVKCTSVLEPGMTRRSEYLTQDKIYPVIKWLNEEQTAFEFVSDLGYTRYGSFVPGSWCGIFEKFPQELNHTNTVLEVLDKPKTINYFGLELQVPYGGGGRKMWLHIDCGGLIIFSSQKPEWYDDCYEIDTDKNDWWIAGKFDTVNEHTQKISLIEVV